MIAGSGQTSAGSSLTWDPDGCCWKTSRSLFDMDYPKSSTTLPNSGSMRNGDCTPRPPLVHHIDDDASGSWPTPTGMDSRSSGGNPNTTGSHGVTLTDATVRSAMWGTPLARDIWGTPESNLAAKANMTSGPRTQPTSLTVQAKIWPTPNAADSERTSETMMRGNPTLLGAGRQWPTPRASDGGGGSDPPRTNDRAGSPTFKAVANEWPGLLGPTTPTDGNDGSQRADLNPSFVAALMGLPWDWLTPSTSAATDSSPNAQQKPGHNSSDAQAGTTSSRRCS